MYHQQTTKLHSASSHAPNTNHWQQQRVVKCRKSPLTSLPYDHQFSVFSCPLVSQVHPQGIAHLKREECSDKRVKKGLIFLFIFIACLWIFSIMINFIIIYSIYFSLKWSKYGFKTDLRKRLFVRKRGGALCFYNKTVKIKLLEIHNVHGTGIRKNLFISGEELERRRVEHGKFLLKCKTTYQKPLDSYFIYLKEIKQKKSFRIITHK